MLKIQAFFQENEMKIVLLLGFVLISGLAFQAGYLKGQKLPQNPLVIEVSKDCPESQSKALETQNEALKNTSIPGENITQKQNCLFVGSKNSTKYHLPDCRSAKRIKPENLVCFKDAAEAVSQGYEPSKDCLN